jgi:hypothetical protein
MKIQEMPPSLLLFPSENNCFQIPPFQRPYIWGLDRVHSLVRDISQAVETSNENGHWLGVILLAASDRPCSMAKQFDHLCWDILDGQQRSLSLRLWLIALHDEYLRQKGEDLPGISRDRLTRITVHSLNAKEWMVIGDQNKLISQRDSFQRSSSADAILRTYWYFRWLLLVGLSGFEGEEYLEAPIKPRKSKTTELDEMTVVDFWLAKNKNLSPLEPEYLLELVKATVVRLTLSVMKHEKQKDEPVEEIFETLNAERTELGQFDLARNFLFISLQTGGVQQQKIYDDYFFKAEQELRNTALDVRRDPLDTFLYDYLISTGKFAEKIGRSNTAASLKSKWKDINTKDSPMKFLTEMMTPAMYAWEVIRSGSSTIKGEKSIELGEDIQRQLMRIESFSKGPFVPITLRILLNWMESGRSSLDGLKGELHLVETFIARSLLAGVPFSPMRRMVMGLCHALTNDSTTLVDWVRDNAPSDERIIQVVTQSCEVDGNESIPENWIFQDDIGERTEPRQLAALFDGLSEHLEGPDGKRIVKKPNTRNNQGAKNSFWVEHYYPQKPEKWSDDLNVWGVLPDNMGNRLNSLGNLSVLSETANKKMSNKSLADKQKDYRDAKVPAFKINHDFMVATRWTHIEIDKRTRYLAKSAIEFWSLPKSL